MQYRQTELFQRAAALHRAGSLAEAERSYRQLLAVAPDHADGLCQLGLLAHQAGQPAAGLPLIDRAISLQPRADTYHEARAQVLKALGRLPDAVAAYRKAVALQPRVFALQYNLGNTLYAAGRFDEAADCHRQAIQLDPKSAAARNNLGNACYALGDLDQAAAAFRMAVQLQPNTPGLLFNLGRTLVDRGAWAEADVALGEVVRLEPEHAPAQEMLGMARAQRGDLAGAVPCFEAAIRLQPDSIAPIGRLGEVLVKLNRFADAEAAVRQALRLQPHAAGVWSILANLLVDTGRMEEAAACCAEALRHEPENANAHYIRSIIDLNAGRFVEGWEGFERRWQAQQMRQQFPGPSWDGGPAPGRVLLVHDDQGQGDYIQFCRFVPLAAQRMKVRLQVPQALRRLLGTLDGAHELVAESSAEPPASLHCPLLSLPRALGVTLETLPSAPYLAAEAPLVAEWRRRLSGLSGLRVGLVWAGNPEYVNDLHRSLSGELLRALVGTPGVSFVSLQKGGASWTAPSPELRTALGLVDWTDELADFADTAALIAALDLVISVDTAVAHLAGAIGQPVWLLNRADTDWRWMRGRTDSPWYPAMRIFRQSEPGGWAGVLAQVRSALAAPETVGLVRANS